MILFHTVANEKVGLGNLSRCIIICNKIKNRGFEVKLFVEGSKEMKKHFAFEEMYFFRNSSALIQKLHLEANGNKEDYSKKIVLVADLPVLGKGIIEEYKKLRVDKLISLNDQHVIELSPNIYINSDDVMGVNEPSIQKFIGPEYQIIREDLADYRPSTLQKIDQIKNVSFIFGGSDPGYLIEDTILQIEKENPPFYSEIVLGPGIDEERKVWLAKKKISNISFLVNPSIPNLISQSDVIVTMGGMTSYEAMYLGKPVLAVEWKYMSKYVKYLEKRGLLISLGNRMSFVSNLIRTTSEVCKLQEVVEKSYSIIDGEGNKRVADIIINSLHD